MKRLTLTALPAAALLALTLLAGCSSDQNIGQGPSSDGGYTYGSGPNHTKPYPQSEKVDLDGVSGSAIRYESVSARNSRDYDVLGKHYEIWRGCDSYIEEGTASWYGPGFHGKKTSNGETYNQKGYTAAHKNLPLPSYLKVTNLENGRRVIVRVNDRGPFHGSRIIDLSEGSAKALNMTGKGTARVRVEYIKVAPDGTLLNATGTPSVSKALSQTPASAAEYAKNSGSKSAAGKKSGSGAVNYNTATAGKTYIQLVATRDRQKALELAGLARKRLSHSVMVSGDGQVNRVLVGPLSESKAQSALSETRSKGFPDSFIKRF